MRSIDPRTGVAGPDAATETTAAELDEVCRGSSAAFGALRQAGRAARAEWLRALAAGLEAERDRIVVTADGETALGPTRLTGELARTCYQLRLFADVVTDGGYLEATIDHAGPTPAGPRPDLRRMLVPTGPVAVFGASNFPLAFSVPGGDTAAALAAGCPVVVKAHESHPATSELCGAVLARAAEQAGAPAGLIAVVHGRAAGGGLVRHPAITAVGFTGSLAAGRALQALIAERPDPIPFYGEFGSLNPIVVTEAAAAERGGEIGAGVAASFTLGAGQFCTKPGLVFVPRGPGGDAVVAAAAEAVRAAPAVFLLNERIHSGFLAGVRRLAGDTAAVEVARGTAANGAGYAAAVRLLELGAGELVPAVTEECFGPVTIVVRYTDAAELAAGLDRVPPSLTATVHIGRTEPGPPAGVQAAMERSAGRLVYNGYPTGVAVAWAQHHGGPWPSTNSLHTSVGPTAIRRFLRPMAWQDAPAAVLPAELRDGPADCPRRVDGTLVRP